MTIFEKLAIILKLNKYASVAQSVVHLTRNEKVACSSQVTSSKTSHLREAVGWFFIWNKMNIILLTAYTIEVTNNFVT